MRNHWGRRLEQLGQVVAFVSLFSGCAAETDPPESMVDGRTLTSDSGELTATFEMTTPMKGLNPIEIHVFATDEAPFSGAEIEISPYMPAHGHGSIDTVATEVEGEPGHYDTDDVTFNMTGYWELRIKIVMDGQEQDTFLVPVNVN